MDTKKVAEKTTGKKPAAPAQVLREQKAKIEEASKVELSRMLTGRHPASDAAEAMGQALDNIGSINVPITLAEICDLIGTDVSPDNFASTAFESIGDQIYTLAALVETDSSNDSWRMFSNLSQRAKLAGRVATFLETESTDGGEVAP